MRADAHEKVNAGHLKRDAYLYVRQSTIRQVFENQESTKRQYALRQHAVALGRMTVRYHCRGTRLVPDYVCQKDGIEHGRPLCQSINGEQVDKTISDLLVQTMTPLALDVALAVQQEIQIRLDEVDRMRRKQVERARYEADLAQRRYMHVDPANRLVADALEAEWNSKLRALNEAQEEYERLCQADHLAIDEAQRARIAALASDFPRLWQDPRTPDREKKRMVRLLLEDVTLLKREQILVHVRFKGGAIKSLSLPLPVGAPILRKTPATVIHEIDRLLDQHTQAQVATILNDRGIRSSTGQAFTPMMIFKLCGSHGFRTHFQRLRERGLLTMEEIAKRLAIAPCVVKKWRDKRLLVAHCYNDKGQCLYEPPPDDLPGKFKKKRPYLVAKAIGLASANEVQYEA